MTVPGQMPSFTPEQISAALGGTGLSGLLEIFLKQSGRKPRGTQGIIPQLPQVSGPPPNVLAPMSPIPNIPVTLGGVR